MAFREIRKNARETVRVTPSVYQGYELIDIRVYAKIGDGKETTPTKKGIAINVDTIPEVIDALTWALGQPCNEDPSSSEHRLKPAEAERLAVAAWQALRKHGAAVHWDSAEKMVLKKGKGFSKWDLHYVLVTRSDLFERVDTGCFRARAQPAQV